MCAGAIVLSRVAAVVWGVDDPKRGGGTVFNVFAHPGINHHPEVVRGVLETPSCAVLQNFFRTRRRNSSCGVCPLDATTEQQPHNKENQ